MNLNNILLLIFPLVLFFLLIWNMKKPEGSFFDEPLEFNNAKAIKGFAAVGIILHHLVQKISQYGAIFKGPVTIFNWMGILFTSIFFFLSGYGLIVSSSRKRGYMNTFLKNRFPSVLIPFYMSNIIYFVVFGIYFEEIDKGLDVALSISGLRLLNTNTWFIVEIIILYLAFYLAYRKTADMDKTINVILVTTLLMIMISLLLGHDYHDGAARNPFQGEWWYNTTFLFWAGMKYAAGEEKINGWLRGKYKALMPISVIAFVLMFAGSIWVTENIGYYQEWEGHPGYIAKALTLLAQYSACFLFIAMLLLICMRRQFGNKVISYLGDISLELYIVHDMVKRILIADKKDENDVIFFIAVIAISLVLAVLLNLADVRLIKMWKGRKAYFAYEPETYEGRERLNREKKIYRICWWVVYLLGAIILVGALADIYGRIVTPRVNYKEELNKLAAAEVGDTVYFGNYERDYLNDVTEKLPWIVLDKKDGKMLLITEEVIESYYFNDEYADSNWAEAEARKALEEYLLPEMFSKYEKKLLITTDNQSICRDGSMVSTRDRLFFLSKEEAATYFADDVDRRGLASSAAKDNGVNVNEHDMGSWWWLRDAMPSEKRTCVVDSSGELSEVGQYSNIISGGVRPAVWIKVE